MGSATFKIGGFNETRARNVHASWKVVIDESMFAFKGQDSPHLSLVPRKPEPVGIEIKNVADGNISFQ